MRLQARRTLIAVALSILCATAGASEAAPASKTLPFSITAPSLVQALIQFTEQSGLQLAFPTQGFGHLPAPRVVGQLTPRDALERLLKDSGLRYEFTNEHTVSIHAATTADGVSGSDAGGAWAGQPESIRLAQSEGQPPAANASTGVEEVVVTGRIVFTQNDAFGATKLGLPVKDTPQTVSIVTSDLMKFASMEAFDDFYKVDASSATSHSIDGFPTNFYRGFRQQGNNAVRVDGFRMPGNIDLDLALFDRFEVIKGPTSTLYGQNSIGGTLNAVSKLPQARAVRELSVEGGQYDDYRIDADLTGPLGGAGTLSYRLIGAYADAESFIDFVNKDVQLVSPSILYRPDDDTRLLLRVTYQKVSDRFHRQAALQLRGEGTGPLLERVLDEGLQIVDVPRSRFYSMPWNRDRREALFVQFQGERRLGNGWTLRAHAQHNEVDQWINGFYTGGPIDQNGMTYYNEIFASTSDNELDGAELNLFGDVEAFGRRHTLFFGADYSIIYNILNNWGYANVSGADTGFNIVTNPDYSLIPEPQSIRDFYPGGIYGDTGLIFRNNDRTDLYGLTAQLMAHPTDKLMVSLGARYSHSAYRSAFTCCGPAEHEAPLPPREPGLKTSKTTFQAGATYAITPDVNAYVTWGQTFFPRDARAFDGRELGPDEGETIEGGFKGELFDKRVFWSAAYFDTAKTNVLSSDPAHPGFQLPLGEERSRGVEADLQGRLLPGWDLYVSAAKMKAEYTEGDLKGITSFLAPKFGLSVFTSYTLQGGTLRGLGFGAGVVYKDRPEFQDLVPGGLVYPQLFSDFTEVDLRVFYEREAWRFDLIGTNVLDEKYRATTFQWLTGAVEFNPPRRVIAKVSYRFGGGSR